LQVTVNRLRRKLEDDPAHPQYILTSADVGYLFARLG
jgi:two-component system KDP operon response regulator KdpE/two-component system response regulator VicR